MCRCIWALGFAMAACCAHAQYVLPKPPPDWESRVTPGFQPSIESTLVALGPNIYIVSQDEADRAWHSWGPTASSPLLGLMLNPAWRGYHAIAFELFVRSPYPETKELLSSRVRQLIAAENPNPEELERLSTLLHMFLHYPSDESFSMASEVAASNQPEIAAIAVNVLLLIHTKEAFDTALSTIKKLSTEVQKQYEPMLADAAGYVRAKEPMPGRFRTHYRSGALLPVPNIPAVQYGQLPPDKVSVRVRDRAGKPLKSIQVVGAIPTLDAAHFVRGEEAHRPTEVIGDKLRSSNGVYEIPNGSYVQAEGLSRRYVLLGPYDSAREPLNVVLGRPSSIEIAVLSEDGKPLRAALVGPAIGRSLTDPGLLSRASRTDDNGTVLFDGLSAGVYFFAIVLTDRIDFVSPNALWKPCFATIRLSWGKHVKRVLRIPNLEAGSPEWMLLALQSQHLSEDRLCDAVAALTPTQRRQVTEVVTHNLRELDGMPTGAENMVLIWAQSAACLRLKAAIKPIERMLACPSVEPNLDPAFQPDALMRALAQIDAVEATRFFPELASNPAAPTRCRQMACIALGSIGTPKSVKAFSELRNAAYAKPGAPAPKSSYTYGERMEEAARMSIQTIPEYRLPTTFNNAWISANYSEGRIHGWACTLHMKRFGDEWLIVKVAPDPVV